MPPKDHNESGRSLRVLVIEDCAGDAELLERALERGGYRPRCHRVDRPAAMSHALDEPAWDIVICDHSMPHFSVVQVLDLLKERSLDVPVIIVSGTIEPSTAVAAMKAGASDFIMKGDLTRLIPAIEREIREARIRQAHRQAEQQVRQAQKMESIGRLAGGIAHDFNNILTAIVGYAGFARETLAPDHPSRTDVEEILRAAERGASLTRQLLTFSRRQVLEPKILDLNMHVAILEKLLRRLIGEHIQVKTSLANGLWHVRIDAGQLEQIIMNLALNARDAMEKKGGTLVLETANLPPDRVALAISDTGAGMSPQTRARIFEPFLTTKPRGRGTGLGLSTVHGIVQEAGGRITVESEAGRGSTFRVFLPRAEGRPSETSAVATAATPEGHETVLLIEDEAPVREITTRALNRFGYDVVSVRNGEEALAVARVRAGRIDLVLSDVVLPGMDGFETVQRLRAGCPALRALYMSGHTDRDPELGRALPEDAALIQKPFSPEALARKVRELLDSPGSP